MSHQKKRAPPQGSPSEKQLLSKTHINGSRLINQEIASVRHGMNHYHDRLESLESDIGDFCSFDCGPGGTADQSRKNVIRRLAELERQIRRAS